MFERWYISDMDKRFKYGIFLTGAPRWKRIALRLLPERLWIWGCNRLGIMHYRGIPLLPSKFLVGHIYPLEGESDG